MVTSVKGFAIKLTILIFPLAAPAAPVELALAPGGSFDVTYSLDTGQSASTNVELSGAIEAEITMDDGAPTGCRFTGGGLVHSDEDLDVEYVEGANVLIETRDVVGVLESGDGPGAITGTGTLVNDGHSLVYRDGTITTRYVITALGAKIPVGEDVRDLSADPDTTALVGTTTLSATLLESGALLSRYRIDLEHERDETRSQPVSGLPEGNTLFIREVGGFSASGDLIVPSAEFAAWAAETRGSVPTALGDRDPTTGQPLAVLYAMRAGAGPWTPPVAFHPADGEVRLALPAEGLRAPIRCEYSATLASDDWTPLGSEMFPEGNLPEGASGAVALAMPPGSRGFVRIAASSGF